MAKHQAEPAVSPRLVETVLTLDDRETQLALLDLDGDADRDLVMVTPAGISVYPLTPAGRFDLGPFERRRKSPAPAQSGPRTAWFLPWPEGRIGFDFADLEGDGAVEVVLLAEDGSAQAFHSRNGRFDGGTLLMTDRAYLPPGVSRVRFVRDVDGDGQVDLIFPGPGSHRIFMAGDEAGDEAGGRGWSAAVEISYDLKAELEVGHPSSFSSEFGQEVNVPWFRIEDIDGDGLDDLVAETEGRIAFHLADPDLSTEPTWVLPLAELEAELPPRGEMDLDNLFSLIELGVSWHIADLDGQGAKDLIVVLGSKLRVYLGGSRTGPDDSPDQVLKSSGNVLYSFVRQAQGDDLPDLQIVRAERISVGRVLRAFVLPSAFDFDLFTYRNEGGTFSRKPTRRNRVTFELPRIFSVMEREEELSAKAQAAGEIRAIRLPRDPGVLAVGDDVVDVLGDEVVLFRGCAPEPSFLEKIGADSFDPEALVETYILEDFDRRGDGAERSLDLEDLFELDFSLGGTLRSACAGSAPVLRASVAGLAVKKLQAVDIDGDGRTDIVAVGPGEGGRRVVQFLVLR